MCASLKEAHSPNVEEYEPFMNPSTNTFFGRLNLSTKSHPQMPSSPPPTSKAGVNHACQSSPLVVAGDRDVTTPKAVEKQALRFSVAPPHCESLY